MLVVLSAVIVAVAVAAKCILGFMWCAVAFSVAVLLCWVAYYTLRPFYWILRFVYQLFTLRGPPEDPHRIKYLLHECNFDAKHPQ